MRTTSFTLPVVAAKSQLRTLSTAAVLSHSKAMLPVAVEVNTQRSRIMVRASVPCTQTASPAPSSMKLIFSMVQPTSEPVAVPVTTTSPSPRPMSETPLTSVRSSTYAPSATKTESPLDAAASAAAIVM